MKLTKEFIGENDMEMQIADYKFRVRELEKLNDILKEEMQSQYIEMAQLRSIEEAHRNINGKLRTRIKRLEDMIKEQNLHIKLLTVHP
jgi:hypothetical protein